MQTVNVPIVEHDVILYKSIPQESDLWRDL